MWQFLTLAALSAAAPLTQAGDPVLEALRLPALATEARRAGVSEAAVRDVLDGLRRHGLPADEAAVVVREEVNAVNAGAPMDNFGEFVQRQLEAGLRGRELADAIRAEHAARGIGRPQRGRPPQAQDTTGPRGRRP